MNKPYFITVVILASGESESDCLKDIEKKLDTLISPNDPTHSALVYIEDAWVDSIEEDEEQSRNW